MTIQRRTFVLNAAVSLCTGPLATAALAAGPGYPGKPITIVYPYAAGGASDAMTRQIADIIAKALGQPVIVDAKPGAGGSMALQQVARASADGHTLVLTASGTMAVNPYLYDLKYKPVEDLAAITILVDIPFVVVTKPDFPARNLKEFIAHAKANPGKISFANAGVGTQAHLTQMMFMKEAGISANVIPYKGGTGAIADLLGGHIDAMIDNAAAQVPNVQAGKVRALFVTTQERSESLPGVPTAQEAGLPAFVTSGWFGLAAPKGTPQTIIDRLHTVIAQGMAQPETRKKLLAAGWMPIGSSPAEAAARARSDLARFGQIARQIELKKD
ncbi:tripartite tricarboxylate transporter substrate binding protein [Variovorax guangxiensis]|uniref:Bug family tripartite tricarboxylate transporter substrate binding protein n=1 Tax=Variovorax guangxiensis TaxID=1775474 RepID=UPI0028615E9F|nr:tripartite tricarboxylate transporter substrate binding protein [Variovorax guangxiensis]MDR6860441.1 tripartite-type tricarboxylate transporter receptor subunit TctC [Variovorax guangxiensis]